MKKITFKNFNKKAICKRICTFALTFTVLGSSAIGLSGCKSKTITTEDKIKIVEQYYGEESEESSILKYLDIAISFPNLDKYLPLLKLNSDMVTFSTELKSPEELKNLIDSFNKLPNFSGDAAIESAYAVLTNELKAQKEFLDEYIQNEAYSSIYDKLALSLKSYVGEIFYIPIVSEIRFYKETENYYLMWYEGPIYDEDNECTDRKLYARLTDSSITSGIDCMIDMKEVKDSDSAIQKKDVFLNALIKADYYQTQVNNKDLYNPRAAASIR